MVVCGLVHSKAGDDLWTERKGERYTCPKNIGDKKWEECYYFMLKEEILTKEGKENLKYRALEEYKTALEPSACEFLRAFIKDEEIFWKMRW